MRFLLCFAVVLLHCLPTSDAGNPGILVVFIASLCRGAVPFFFVASGYFVRAAEGATLISIARPLQRLLPVYVVWMLIYAVASMLGSGSAFYLSVRSLLAGGGAFHLWFLPVLGFCLAVLPLAVATVGRCLTAALCLAAAFANIMFVAYRSVLHLPEIGGTRLMMAPLLVYSGMEFARHGWKLNVRLAALLILGAWAATFAEELFIAALTHQPVISHSSGFATFALGMATFAFARALPDSRILASLAKLGQVSLGIYVSHLLFVRLLGPLVGRYGLPQETLLAVSAFVLSTILCVCVARVDWLRRLVS